MKTIEERDALTGADRKHRQFRFHRAAARRQNVLNKENTVVDVLSVGFLSALAAIVVIDLVLAGDNAIVIALAARNLKLHLRKLAIIWGTVGAITVRAGMTLIVVWGSQIVLKVVDRFPAVEPLIEEAIVDEPLLVWTLYAGLTLGVISLALLRNQLRKQDRLEARLSSDAVPLAKRGNIVTRVLIPIDGSKNALGAVRKIVASAANRTDPLDVHLVNVRGPLSRHVAGFLRRSDVAAWHCDEGLKALNGAMQLLKVPVEVIPGRQSSTLERIGIPAGIGAAVALLAMAD
jgi:hypothetical protein